MYGKQSSAEYSCIFLINTRGYLIGKPWLCFGYMFDIFVVFSSVYWRIFVEEMGYRWLNENWAGKHVGMIAVNITFPLFVQLVDVSIPGLYIFQSCIFFHTYIRTVSVFCVMKMYVHLLTSVSRRPPFAWDEVSGCRWC